MDEQSLRSWAAELGFSRIGLCSLAGFDGARQMVFEQEPLRERNQLRFYPQTDYPQARSLAVLLWPYAPAAIETDEALFVDSYYQASNAAYHAARALEACIQAAGCFAKANASYPAKDAAVRAGLGMIGKHSLLIAPEYGTRVVIILMATDIEPEKKDRCTQEGSTCLACGRCAAACPSGAIDAHGMTHPERCLRNFMMEGVVVPEHLREKIGMRLIGCDVCQRVCPMQPRRMPAPHSGMQLCDFVTEDAEKFSASTARLAEQIGRNAARPQRIRAQAALLAGNSGNPEYLPVLRAWAQLPFEAVSEHAKWAIRRIELENGGA